MPPAIDHAPRLQTLTDFYDLMERTRDVRVRATADILAGKPPNGAAKSLENALASLEALSGEGNRRRIRLNAERDIELDLSYEISETRKDLIYLREGEAALLRHLAKLHPRFTDEVEAGRKLLADAALNCLVSDRDGTVSNYCGRYRSSIQSVYNAVFLTRFAASLSGAPVVMTSAPLTGGGILDVSVTPPGSFVYAASKGRECVDLSGKRHAHPIDPQKQERLQELNDRLETLVGEERYATFGLIGSGLQFKFGQTTVARQDVNSSIDEKRSKAFLDRVKELVRDLDPEGETFRIEDTGLDIEIILTVSGETGLKDFDKGDGVAFLDQELSLGLGRGPNLICGDTPSDVPMLEAALAKTKDVKALFVTRRDDLAERVRAMCPDALVVGEPDSLVAVLGALGR